MISTTNKKPLETINQKEKVVLKNDKVKNITKFDFDDILIEPSKTTSIHTTVL